MVNQPLNPNFFASIRHRCVQDLAWCLFSPPLIADTGAHKSHTVTPTATALNRIRALDNDPSPLEKWLSSGSSQRLGLIFERFWQFWWQQDSDGSQWQFNQQINRDGRTLGELDALQWQPDTCALTHYELAVKFYLQVPASALSLIEPDALSYHWVGPNLFDRLDLKWPQMRDRQLTMLSDASRCPELPWTADTLITKSLTRGRLFTPRFSYPELSNLPLASDINPQHDRGQWLHLNDWPRLESAHWKLLHRQDWFAPVHGSLNNEFAPLTNTQAFKALSRHFEQFRQPAQIVRLEIDDTRYRELERLFIVPPNWPCH
ncbi:MAG: DUF1853 family protein [Cellvibrionaceae bacterium]